VTVRSLVHEVSATSRRHGRRIIRKLVLTGCVLVGCAWLAGAATWSNLNATTTAAVAFSADSDWVPPAGGSVAATGLGGTNSAYSTSTTLHLALAKGTDSGSGLATTGSQLLRATATLSSSNGLVDGVCGTNSAFAQVGSNDPTSPATDTVPTDARCYQYEYLVPDNSGNTATYTSPEIKVQTTTAPLTTSGLVITPVTGTSAQVVSGTSVSYQAPQSGSFTVQASLSDSVSGVTQVTFPVIAGFSGGGVVTTPVSGTTFRTTYSWSNNGTSPSPGAQTITATDGAGLSHANAGAFSIVKAVTATTNVLSLTAATNAYLTGSNLYYRPTVAGSFKLVDAFSAPAGPASVTYPAIGVSGWTHNTETVSTPSGGPYTSSAFSWNAQPNSAGSYTVSGLDAAGTTSTTTFTFIGDQSPPSGGTISYPTGLLTVPSVPITTTTGTDSGAGVNAASGVVTRDQIPLNTATNSCTGSFPNTYATTVTLVGGADTSVLNGFCYQYRYSISDNVGNVATYTASSQSPVDIDTTPKVTAISSLQSNGTAGDGQLELGDKLVLTFNENLATATVPTTFASATEARTGSGVVTLTIPGFTNGAISTGSGSYLAGQATATATFGGTTVLANNGASTTVTLTVTSLSGAATAASSGTLPFVAAPTITGTNGTGASGTFTPTGSFRLF
jgi:hypothetical protein